MRSRLSILILIIWMLLSASCGSGQKQAEVSTEKELPVIDGHTQLDRSVTPRSYAIYLEIDPSKDRFTGSVEIELALSRESDFIQMHGEDMDFVEVYVQAKRERYTPEVIKGENGGIGLKFENPVPMGKAVLYISYRTDLDEVPMGLYRVKAGDDWYAFTQFEPMEAREAFPCFDQPGFKTPYNVKIRIPKGLTAHSNSALLDMQNEGEYDVFRFMQTEPLPTYLVAFAAGRFDIVECEQCDTDTPIRVLAPRGKGILADYVLDRTPVILGALENYFGMKYPFDKLDLVAVPNFAAGAMENVGLVTFRESLILIEEEKASAADRMRSQTVIAHELAHMWFGNLVTLEWWNDLWLNEAFATWIQTPVIDQVDPELEASLQFGSQVRGVMNLDAQKDARAIRQPIEHGGDIYNAFDGITYVKGAAIIQMIESWTGAQSLRRGVQDYMNQHARKVTTNRDMLMALNIATGKPVSSVMSGFLDQPGTPFISFETSCGLDGVKLRMTQQRYKYASSKAPEGHEWQIPVCIRYFSKGEEFRECILMEEKTKEFTLAGSACPQWLYPNADENGYYRWRLPEQEILNLVHAHLTDLKLRERIALSDHMIALLEAGHISVFTYMDSLRALATGYHRMEVEGVIRGLSRIHRIAVGPETREPFAAYVQSLLRPHMERIGVVPQGTMQAAGAADETESAEIPDEDPPADAVDDDSSEPVPQKEKTGDTLLRPSLIIALADMGLDSDLRTMAAEYTDAFLEDPGSVDQSMAEVWLQIAAWDGSMDLWQKMTGALKTIQTPVLRRHLIAALGSFRNPDLVKKSFDLVLDGTLYAQDLRTIASYSTEREYTQKATWQWMTQNYDGIIKKMGSLMAPRMPWTGAGFCSEKDVEALSDFFKDESRRPAGTNRNLALVKEFIKRCASLRKMTQAPISEYLKN